MVSDDLLDDLNEQIPCRQTQLKQLASLLDVRNSYTIFRGSSNKLTTQQPDAPTSSTIVLYGLEATGKSLSTRAVLDALETAHAIIDSRECITTRHLLDRTVAECKAAIQQFDDRAAVKDVDSRCESVSVLVARLQKLLEHNDRKFILVFDGIDKQREAPPTLLPAIARLGEIVRSPIAPRS